MNEKDIKFKMPYKLIDPELMKLILKDRDNWKKDKTKIQFRRFERVKK